ncbi:MAG: sulfotransferase, partial [Proteobacteria bacterium]|nr:sulfotransferase [Pseudomonadota bacterium]
MTAAEVSLELDSIVAEARDKTGLREFGDESFREPLGRLLRSLDTEAQLSPTGRATQRTRLVDSLATRLLAEDAFRRHPEIGDEKIEAPVVIVGLARTGTTMLHRLLASGGDFQSAAWWECRYPAPFPGSDWRRDDPRVAAAHEEVDYILESVPVLASIHPWDAEGADEEIMLLEHSFLSHVPESGANLPSYRTWLDQQDLTPGYRYLRRLLQFLQWQKRESGRPTGRWVLKAPFHLGYVDTLRQVFPGARIVQTHRDPLQTIPSAASMYRSLWELASDRVDAVEVGRQVCERYAWALTRCMHARENHPVDTFLDVDYRDVQKDPLTQVRRIYDWLGQPLSNRAEAAMSQWLVDNSRDKRAAHRYTLEEFGYTE